MRDGLYAKNTHKNNISPTRLYKSSHITGGAGIAKRFTIQIFTDIFWKMAIRFAKHAQHTGGVRRI